MLCEVSKTSRAWPSTFGIFMTTNALEKHFEWWHQLLWNIILVKGGEFIFLRNTQSI